MTTAALIGPSGAAPALAGHGVQLYFIEGASNIECEDLDTTYGGDQTWIGFKLQDNTEHGGTNDLANGTYTVPGAGTITISNFTPSNAPDAGSFDWVSDFGIDAVLVKTGTAGKNLYVYAPDSSHAESFGGTNLQTPTGQGNGFSHLSFCYDLTNPTPTPTPTPTPPPTPTPTPTPPPPTPTPTPTPPPPTPTPVPTPTPTPTPAGEVAGETGTPAVTLPPTDTLSGSTQAPSSDSWRLILLAMAGILATTLLLTPAESVARRKDR